MNNGSIRTGAVDIGGTKIQVGVVNERGQVLAEESFPTETEKRSAAGAVEKIADILSRQCDELQLKLENLRGIGISCAGPVDCEKGTMENPYTLMGWKGFPIVDSLSQRTGLLVKLENDANGALLGEVSQRRLEQNKVLMVTIGTGIGVAFWNAGSLYRNGKYHPEMGHVIVSSKGECCYCGHRGCFESRCSGKALNARSQKAGFSDFDELYQQAGEENKEAVSLLAEMEDDLKNGLWTLNLIFKPDTIILAGGFSNRYFPFLKKAIQEDSEGKDDFLNSFDVFSAYGNKNSALAGATMLF